MEPNLELAWESIRQELKLLWAAHNNAGLKGYMKLFTDNNQAIWRSASETDSFWFTQGEDDKALECIKQHYNDGKLPNTTLLLNPIVHEKVGDTYKPIGSGIAWATSFVMGISTITDDQIKRLHDLGAFTSYFHRGENVRAGIKVLLVSKTPLAPVPDGLTVTGCKDLYELSNMDSPLYAPFYLLSGLNYLCMHGMFNHPHVQEVLPEADRYSSADDVVKKHAQNPQRILDANQCWNAYDRQHTLYMRFGQNPKDIEHNNRFYNLCARDLQLFDRTGPQRIGADESFEFIVPGMIPRGAVTLIAASGGTGKSSAAHYLCVLASIDWKKDEQVPLWMGQPINTDVMKGICVYFSGEDGPGIINARAALFDPEGRSNRLQFHRTEFMDQDIPFSEYLRKLRKMPDVPIIVIDPARKYLSGDENDAEVVSEFFEAIEEFAIEKKTAMIVVHHLQKGANPQSARQVLDELRGSQVFIDRPRVVIGMYRDGPHTVLGLAKNNIPPNLGMIQEERVFYRNPKNLTLMWVPGEAGVRRDGPTQEELDRIEIEAMKAAVAEGSKEDDAKVETLKTGKKTTKG